MRQIKLVITSLSMAAILPIFFTSNKYRMRVLIKVRLHTAIINLADLYLGACMLGQYNEQELYCE